MTRSDVEYRMPPEDMPTAIALLAIALLRKALGILERAAEPDAWFSPEGAERYIRAALALVAVK
jgi:hypothetical protein